MKMLTVERLQELLHYDPATGVFTRSEAALKRYRTKRPLGTIDDKGYLRIKIDGRSYRAQRLAWLWMTGAWPVADIDHRDLNRANNCWENLREATDSQNKANMRARSDNKSGFKGVSWDKAKQKWIAQIEHYGKGIKLGRFDCRAAAHFAYIIAADKYFGEFSRAA